MHISQSSIRRALWLGAELVVVFVGVYAAFWLEGYRQDARDAERRAHIVAAIDEEAAAVMDQLDRAIPAFDSTTYEPFATAYRNGERPPLRPLYYYSPGTGMERWQAMLAAGGVDILDVSVINAAQAFYTTARELEAMVAEARSMSTQLLVSDLGGGAGTFYDAAGQLHPRYRWYPMMLHRMRTTVRKLRDDAAALRTALAEADR
jgi:hypothetical protein